MRSTIRRPKTIASDKELLASRLAPCTPVEETSPQANRRETVLSPFRSVLTPPSYNAQQEPLESSHL